MSSENELLTTSEMGEADRLAPTFGMPSLALMEKAGAAVAAETSLMVPAGSRVAILCGPGNNGGDGFVAARHLRERGYRVRVALLGAHRLALKGDAAIMADRHDGPVLDGTSVDSLCRLWADLIVDAMYGAGLSRPLSGEAAAAVASMNGCGKPVLAVDVPSGLDGTTGAATGPVVQATRTITFFRRKPGHLLLPGRQLCGPVALYDIGMPVAVLEKIKPLTYTNAPSCWRERFPRPTVDGHKYTRGHAVIVSGGIEMSGAARLCARGALRVGAGLVTVATPLDALHAHAAQLNATLLKTGTTPADITQLLTDRRFTAVGIGPGLGRGEQAFDQVMAVLAADAPAMLDADAITMAAAKPEALFRAIAARERPVVLTPHEGEFNRLFPDVTGAKLERAHAAARISGGIVLLKGADTVIASPDGRSAINENAPPWLATAGSGDVLAGFVTGLLAHGMPAFEAACAAVWLHGECGNAFGAGLIAEDIPEALPKVLAILFRI